jgi:hypothetical protein
MMLLDNHNVVVRQGELSSENDIRTRSARLRDLTWLSISQNACFGDRSDEVPSPAILAIGKINQRNYCQIEGIVFRASIESSEGRWKWRVYLNNTVKTSIEGLIAGW